MVLIREETGVDNSSRVGVKWVVGRCTMVAFLRPESVSKGGRMERLDSGTGGEVESLYWVVSVKQAKLGVNQGGNVVELEVGNRSVIVVSNQAVFLDGSCCLEIAFRVFSTSLSCFGTKPGRNAKIQKLYIICFPYSLIRI